MRVESPVRTGIIAIANAYGDTLRINQDKKPNTSSFVAEGLRQSWGEGIRRYIDVASRQATRVANPGTLRHTTTFLSKLVTEPISTVKILSAKGYTDIVDWEDTPNV